MFRLYQDSPSTCVENTYNCIPAWQAVLPVVDEVVSVIVYQGSTAIHTYTTFSQLDWGASPTLQVQETVKLDCGTYRIEVEGIAGTYYTQNFVVTSQSQTGYSAEFDGINQFGSRYESLSASNKGTFMTWVKVLGSPFPAGIYAFGGTLPGSGGIGGLRLSITNTIDAPRFLFEQRKEGGSQYSGYVQYATGASWHHLAVKSDGSSYSFYVDGVNTTPTESGRSNDGLWFDETAISGTPRSTIGCLYLAGYTLSHGYLRLDDLCYSNQALSDSQIKEAYDLGAGSLEAHSAYSDIRNHWKMEQNLNDSKRGFDFQPINTPTYSTDIP